MNADRFRKPPRRALRACLAIGLVVFLPAYAANLRLVSEKVGLENLTRLLASFSSSGFADALGDIEARGGRGALMAAYGLNIASTLGFFLAFFAMTSMIARGMEASRALGKAARFFPPAVAAVALADLLASILLLALPRRIGSVPYATVLAIDSAYLFRLGLLALILPWILFGASRAALKAAAAGGLGRLYDPASFQGAGFGGDPARRRGYFEGWYFKMASRAGEVVAFIPGISLSEDPHAFIQVNDGPAGKGSYFRYPLEEFRASGPGGEFWIEIGGNRFSRRGASVDIPGAGYSARLSFEGALPYPARFLSPGIMGWYSFLPFMECYHGLVSLGHSLSGRISTPSGEIDFDRGRGYIEKDWGRSFPEAWIWMQSNLFDGAEASFMFSIAKIPWLGRSFPGFLCFLRCGGRTLVFASYNGARISEARAEPSSVEAVIERRRQRLRVRAEYGRAGTLSAPVRGKMERPIKESVDSRVFIEYADGRDGFSFSGTGIAAGLEMVGDIEGLIGAAGPSAPRP